MLFNSGFNLKKPSLKLNLLIHSHAIATQRRIKGPYFSKIAIDFETNLLYSDKVKKYWLLDDN